MKKASVLSFLITLLLAAAVCIRGETVKDSAGHSLAPGQLYYIVPVNSNGGGLVPAPPRLDSICPLGIAQTLLEFIPGVPVSFSFPLAYMESSTISIHEYVAIEFKSKIWLCPGSKFWKAGKPSPTLREDPPLLVGGTPWEPENQFKIEYAGEKAGPNTYKLTSRSHLSVGSKLGVWGVSQLVLTNDKPLLFKFKKVDDATTAASSSPLVEKLSLRLFPF